MSTSTSKPIAIPETKIDDSKQSPLFEEWISDGELSDLEDELRDLDENQNIRRAYAIDIASDSCDPDDLAIDSRDVWDWQVSMRMDYESYKNKCPYCPQGSYTGLKCPECRRWYIPLGLCLYNKTERERYQKKYAIKLKWKEKKKNLKSECYTRSRPNKVYKAPNNGAVNLK